MIAKELRGAWWKLGLGLVLLFSLFLSFPVPPPYGEILETVRTWPVNGPEFPKPEPVDFALEQLSVIYGVAGGLLLVPLALLLGVGVISNEVDKSTIFLLLSKPISRTRLLLTKYAVGGGILLASAVLGCVVLIVSAAVKGYPLGSVSIVGVALSVVLLWLGSLLVLSVASLASVLFRDAIKSFALAGVLVFLLLSPDNWMNYFFRNEYLSLGLSEGFPRDVTLFYYWFSGRSYLGEGLSPTDFIVCLLAAVVPLLLALWLLNRKAY
jgi:ABC-type transport system involved in multi-copper enzyme maturation permease subunit